MAWYKDWFGEDYLKVYPHRDEAEAKRQVDFVEKILALKPSQQILDLGCGSGRHANEMSRRGYHVTCLDLSAVLLHLAQEQYGTRECCLRFVRADMRHIPFIDAFDAVLSFFTTFGYFKTDEENLMTLQSIRSALKSGGAFVQDYINKDFTIENLVARDTRTQDGVEVIQQRRYNEEEQRIEKKITLKANGQVREYFESVRLYSLSEMEELLQKAKLTLTAMYGDFDGSKFSTTSPRLILVGKREA